MTLPVPADTDDVRAARNLAVSILTGPDPHAALTTAGLLDADLPVPVALAVAEEQGRAGHLDAVAGPDSHPLLAAAALAGAGAELLTLGISYAGERRAFGRALSGFQVQRHAFARAAAGLAASRALTWRAADVADPWDLISALPVAAEAAWLAADTALQVHGGNGYSDDYPVSWRWTQVARIRARIRADLDLA